LTHILGYNGITDKILKLSKDNKIVLIEDVCESHGATFNGVKVGSIGDVSNFSFYYAHHMTSIEGGMVCTNDKDIYEMSRIMRSHGMLRESSDQNYIKDVVERYPKLNKDFIFLQKAYNMRSTELNAVLALNQLPRLDENNIIRKQNLDVFLDNLDSTKYFTEFNREGNSNYAFTLLLRNQNLEIRDKVEKTLRENGVEFRRGMSGGGNQLRQPYLINMFGGESFAEQFVNCDYVHFYGWYIGNYPGLKTDDIVRLCNLLNEI
jgi:CDP-6-deoxy-D-xylo-4-hexulose-3-dehydrase